MPVFEDAVRPFQLAETSQTQLYLGEAALTSQAPVIITPGQGGTPTGQTLQTSRRTITRTITHYMEQAQVEQTTSSG